MVKKYIDTATVIEDLEVKRQLKLISNPNRYRSRAAEAFLEDVLPIFAGENSQLNQHILSNKNNNK